MTALDKLEKLLAEQEADDEFEDAPEFDDGEVMEKMLNLILSLDDVQLTDEQANKVLDILNTIDPDEVSEVFKRRQRRDLAAARQRRRKRRTKRTKLKLKARRYRRSAAGKKTMRRTLKYQKPRSYYCGMGICNECLVTLEDGTRVRSCQTFASPSMKIKMCK